MNRPNTQQIIWRALYATADARDLSLTVADVQDLAIAATRALASTDGVPAGTSVKLTNQRSAVLRGLACGSTAGEIARQLCISTSTVRTHRRLLYRQLGVHTSAQAVAVGMRMGLLPVCGPMPGGEQPTAVAVEESVTKLRAILARQAGERP